MKYTTEMKKLEKMLLKAKANYRLHFLYDGFQIILYDNNRNRVADAICHNGSYGHDYDLLEIYGLGTQNYDDVEGYLTAEEVFKKWEPFI